MAESAFNDLVRSGLIKEVWCMAIKWTEQAIDGGKKAKAK
jgi:hypothetical protein